MALLTLLADAARRRRWLHDAVLACRRCRARAIDSVLGIAAERADDPRHGVCCDRYTCDAIDYPRARRMLCAVALRPDDVVYDLGCGAGRLLCVAARRHVARCVGVEISPTLANAARENARGLRGRRSPVEIICADASTLEYDDGTVFLMFNPFGEWTMRAVITRIEDSLRSRPREVRIAYGNPMHEDVLEQCAWLQRCGEHRSAFYERPTGFWRSKPNAMPTNVNAENAALAGVGCQSAYAASVA